jgi:pimeloyl-ACP methyl ester carboxylesterase
LILPLCEISNKTSINYERFGNTASNYKLVIIHGAGGTLNDLKSAALFLSNDFECIVIDLPNHGKSGSADTNTITDYAGIIKEFISTILMDQNVVVIGHSMGGAIALDLAVNNNLNNLKGLVILNSGAYFAINESFIAKLKRGKIDIPFMIKNGGTPFNINVIKYFLSNRDLMKQVPRLYQDFLTTKNYDLRDKLGIIKANVLTITGEKDFLAPREYAEYLKSHISNCKLKIFPQYGHLLPVAAPSKVAEEIAFFINGLGTKE